MDLIPDASAKARPLRVQPAFFMMGATSVVTQAVCVRELLVSCYGNELFLGVILACWLLWIAIGAQIGTRLAQRSRRPERLWTFLLAASTLLPGLQSMAARLGRVLMAVGPGMDVTFGLGSLLALLVTAPFCLLVGLTFPLGVRVGPANLSGARRIGQLFALEAAGALFGGTIFSLLLVHWLDNLTAVALLSLGLACSIDLQKKRSWRRSGLSWAAGLAAGIVLLAVLPRLDRLTIDWRWQTLAAGVALHGSQDTPYQNVAIAKRAEQYTIYLNGQPSVSFPDRYTFAPEAWALLLQHPQPRHALLVGNSAVGWLPELLAAGLSSATVVVPDERLHRALEPLFDPFERAAWHDPRTRLVFDDGRRYVRNAKNRYDIVAILAGPPSTASANRFYTQEFFADVSRILTPQGVFSLSLPGAATVLSPEQGLLHRSIVAALRSAFTDVVVRPGVTTTYYASMVHGAVTTDPQRLASRLSGRTAPRPYFSVYHLEWLFEAERIRAFWSMLESFEPVAANQDAQPMTFYYDLLLWDRLAAGERAQGSALSALLRTAQKLQFGGAAAIGAGLLALRLLWAWRRRRCQAAIQRFNSLATIATTGLAAMGLEVILLLSFQSIFGDLYEMVAMLIGAYMLGLALGAWTMAVHVDRLATPVRWLFCLQLALALLAASAVPLASAMVFPLAARGAGLGQAVFWILLGLAGLLAGAQFPLAARLYSMTRPQAERTAGRLDAADHAGAALGALTVGGLWVPVLGTAQASALLALLMMAVALLWPLSPRRSKNAT